MWPNNSLTCFGLVWIFLSFCHHPVAGLLHYSITDPLATRLNVLEPPPPVLQHPPVIARPPRRRYIHRGSRRHVQHSNNSTTINSTWSTSRRSPINSGRTVNHHALASLARSANATVKLDSSAINFGLLNIRSLTSKGHLIQDLLTDRKFDFLCLTETWQQPNDFSQLNESTPPGFVYICQPRGSGRGGGLAIIHREKWKVSRVSVPAFSSFESIVCQLSGPTPTIIATVYRPPKPNSVFLSDFADFLTHLSTLSPNAILPSGLQHSHG
ncbi:hypothetical protein N1851_023824 [Merluccius polli]|uniref:Endonuclease/exonuclease/phosphatase domain-containing protein n=1 Tax=Merluccius polli TaxID=89951 RepID=A0AA47MG48_MERPO|nr:hypothetical protein N1851_023824 [Merluccius polli]